MPNSTEYTRDKEGSSIAKIVVNRDLCIGVGSCIAVSNKTFKLDPEAKAVVTDPNAEDDATIMTAAKSCPVQAIFLIDKAGKQIFP